MKTAKNNLLWAVSLIMLGAAAAMQFGLRLAGVPLPDALARLFGAVSLPALFLLSFATARRLRGRASEEGGHWNGDQ